jgi:hypothetical protein
MTVMPAFVPTARLVRRVRAALGRPCDPASRSRGRRVALLIFAVALMGLADLLCTLAYMHTVGMMEANPIARHMIDLNGSQQLVLFKLLTISLSSAALWFGRFHRQTELCAWGCVALMLMLTAHWVRYNREVVEMSNEIAVIALHHSGPDADPACNRWISFAQW